jgi:hypothetical protein
MIVNATLRTGFFILAVVSASSIAIAARGHFSVAKAASGAATTRTVCDGSLPCLVERNKGSGAGIVAGSVKGQGIISSSRQSSGVLGLTFNDPTQNFSASAGVWGADQDANIAGGNAGVMGTTTYGDGVVGATHNPSMESKQITAGVIGVDQGDGNLNIGVQGIAVGTAMLAVSLGPQQPPGQTQFPALSAVCTGGSVAITADNGYGSPIGDVMSLDCAGNMILKGTLVTQGTPLIRVGAPNTPGRAAYTAEQAQPAIEDDGEARIANGSGYVSIDASFAQAADLGRGYSVFLTPEGPSQGLYVTNKSTSGFSVRENPGGHSSIGFAYRIVASPQGAQGTRLPDIASVRAGLYREAKGAPHNSAMGRALMNKLKMRK